MIIAIFYSTGLQWLLLTYTLILLLILYFVLFVKINTKYLILIFGVNIWYLFLKAGIHPTVAGVLLAFAVPIRQKIDIITYSSKLASIVKDIRLSTDNRSPTLSKEQIEQIDNLEDWTTKVQSPFQLLEHRLHNWVAHFIMPFFALANAGIAFGKNMNLDYSLISTIAICLVPEISLVLLS